MANVKISNLPAASTPLTGAELVPVVQSGVTSQTTTGAVVAPLTTSLAANTGSTLVGYLPSGGTAVATTVQAKLRETVSVKDFGAVGDGVADDKAAIQKALDTGNTVYFPSGTYKITSGISVNTGQLVDGNLAKIKPVGTFNAITLNASGFIVRDLVVDATGLTGNVFDAPTEIGGGTFWLENINSTGGTIGLNMVNQYSAYITNCRFAYCTQYCVYLTSTVGFGGINSLWFSGCYFVNSGSSGLPIVFLKATAGIYFDKCTWQGNNANTIGMQVESVNGLYLTNNYIEDYSTLRWLWLYNATTANVIQFVVVTGNYFLMDGIPVVFGTNSKTNVQIVRNTFQTTGASSGAAVQGMITGFIPQVHSNLGSRQDIDDSFTPTIQFGGANIGITYTQQTGIIRNYGNYLIGGISIKLSSKGTSTGNITVNIPSTMLLGVTNQNVDGNVTTGTYANLASITTIYGGLDNSSIRLYNNGATSSTAITDSNFTNTSEIYIRFRTRFVDISQ